MSISTVVFICLVQSLLVCGDKNKLNNFLFNGDFEFIDLTYPFDKNTVYWPNAQDFQFTRKIANVEQDGSWYAANDFAAGEHGGTHIDAPYHFSKTGNHVGDLDLDKLIVPLIIVDVSSQVNDNPNFVLHKQNLDYLLNDNFGKPCVIIFKFGWSKYFHDKKRYLGLDLRNGTLNFPGLGADIAEWIVKSYKNVVGIGVDVASVDPGSSEDYPVHKIASEAGLYNLENVNLSQHIAIPDYGCTALVMPMKIAEGTGAPLRLVAICPKQIPTSFDKHTRK